MASSLSARDEWNPVLWLATRAGKMAQSCPLQICLCTVSRSKIVFFCHIENPLLNKLVLSTEMTGCWPRFLARLWIETESVSRSNNRTNIHPCWPTSLVNNPYLMEDILLLTGNTGDGRRRASRHTDERAVHDQMDAKTIRGTHRSAQARIW